MIEIKSGSVSYECTLEHRFGEACSGHSLELIYDPYAHTTSVIVDGAEWEVIDENRFAAMLEAHGKLLKRLTDDLRRLALNQRDLHT
jgi:CRP-like cAMP-binding protein